MKFYSFVLAFLAAVFLFVVINPYNLGFSPDSMVYLETSENLLSKKGLTNDLGDVVDHWPPLYALLLTATSIIAGVDPQFAGLILHPFLLFLLVTIYSKILYRIGIDSGLIIVSTILLILSPVVTNFLFFLSEGLFLVLLFFSFYYFLKWHQSSQLKNLMLAGLFCGLLFLTRYAGIGFIGGFLVFMLFESRKKDNWRNLFYFTGVLATVILPWFMYLSSFADNPAGRRLGIYIISLSKLMDALATLGYWFLGSTPAIIATGILIVVYLVEVSRGSLEIKNGIKVFREYHGAVKISLFLIFIYGLFLIISISFYDPWTPLDNRILSPIFPFVLLLISLFFQVLKAERKKPLLITTIFLLLLNFSSSTFDNYLNHYKEGGGYSKGKWEQSEIMDFIKQYKFPSEVYTNGIEIAKLHADKDFKLLPFNSKRMAIEELVLEVRNRNAQIVYFDEINWRNYLVSKREILDEFKNSEVLYFKEGFIIRNITFE